MNRLISQGQAILSTLAFSRVTHFMCLLPRSIADLIEASWVGLVLLAEQLGGYRVAVSLVADQDAAEVVAGRWVEGREQSAEVRIGHSRTLAQPSGSVCLAATGTGFSGGRATRLRLSFGGLDR